MNKTISSFIPSLIAMKYLSYSPQHQSKGLDDLRGLVQHSSSEQREEAARLVGLIPQRGFSRQEDLAAKLDELYRELIR